MPAVFLAFEGKFVTRIIASWSHHLTEEFVISIILTPVWRTDPYRRNITNLAQDGTDAFFTSLHIRRIQFVAAQTYKDMGRFDTLDIMLQGIGSSPVSGARTHPGNTGEFMTVLVGIISQSQTEIFRHRVAEDQYSLRRRIHGFLYHAVSLFLFSKLCLAFTGERIHSNLFQRNVFSHLLWNKGISQQSSNGYCQQGYHFPGFFHFISLMSFGYSFSYTFARHYS